VVERSRTLTLGILITLGSLAAPADDTHADRKPTPQERSRAEERLRQLGYVQWVDIEIEEGNDLIEIEGALHVSGRRHDLKLRTNSLEIVSRKRD
jgi:hypothetical protein